MTATLSSSSSHDKAEKHVGLELLGCYFMTTVILKRIDEFHTWGATIFRPADLPGS